MPLSITPRLLQTGPCAGPAGLDWMISELRWRCGQTRRLLADDPQAPAYQREARERLLSRYEAELAALQAERAAGHLA